MRRWLLSGVLTGLAAAIAACSTGGTGLTGTGASGSTGGNGSGSGAGLATGSGTASTGTAGGASTGTASTGTGGSGTGGMSTGSASTGSASTGSAGTASTGSGGSASTGSTMSGSSGSGSSSASASSSSGAGGAASGSSSSSSGGSVTFAQGCNGAHTTVTGVTYAPNGTDPIPNVRVYDAEMINPFPTNYCDNCSQPIDPAYVSTKSAADGSYTLDLDNVPQTPTIDFAIQIGRFRKHTNLAITPCQANMPPLADETLPGNSTAGDIPNIAVSSGNVDHLDAVLNELGITQYDCYEGRKTAGASTATCNEATATTNGKVIADVLQNSTLLDPYNMVFLSCAPDAYAYYITNHNQAMMTANTQQWVQSGGRMFVTDTAYDYIAQAFPSGLTWAGPTGTPQPVDGANEGCAPGASPHTVPYTVTIDDPTLAQWLQVGVHVIPPLAPSPPTVQIEGFYQPWSVVSMVPPTSLLIADGTLPIDPNYTTKMCASPTMMDVPLTAQFDVPTCGRVIFSSYHTYSAGGNASIAQLKIMEFLIFAAAFCTSG